MKIELESPIQTVPESSGTNADFTRTNNTQSLPGANRHVCRKCFSKLLDFWMGKRSHVLCKNNRVREMTL